jgi:GTP-binding protein Era
MTRAGIVTVVGKPNAGKSTLLNRIIGQKLSITSPEAAVDARPGVGIHTDEGVQMIVLDTPGLLNPRYALQQAMRGIALEALRDADVIVHMVDRGRRPARAARDGRGAAVRAVGADAARAQQVRSAVASRATRARERVPGRAVHSAVDGSGVPELLPRPPRSCPRARSSIRTTRSARRRSFLRQ